MSIPCLTTRFVPPFQEPVITALAIGGRAIYFTDGAELDLHDWFEAFHVTDWTFPQDGSVRDGVRIVSKTTPMNGCTFGYDTTRSEYDRVMAWMIGVEQKRCAAAKRMKRR